MSADPHNLGRFVEAQAPVIDRVLHELRIGRKTTHWIWFVFPQLAGLGRSHMARTYAIGSLAEADAYIAHETLGPRLRECARRLLDADAADIVDVLGDVDSLKVRSCMTLFAHVAPDAPEFGAVLSRYFAGEADPFTLERIAAMAGEEAGQAP